MNRLRLATWAISAVLHLGGVLALNGVAANVASFDVGTGNDEFVLEKGIAIEGVGLFGQDRETVQAVEVPPQERVDATPPVEQVKPLEKPEVITSTATEQTQVVEAQEPIPEPPKVVPPTPPPPMQMAAVEIPAQTAVSMEASSAKAQTGGDAKLLAMYRGEVAKKLQKNKVLPKTRATGLVVLRFTVDMSGELISREIEKSSGSKVLDDAAVAALEKSAPFPPIPDGATGKPLVMTVPYEYIQR